MCIVLASWVECEMFSVISLFIVLVLRMLLSTLLNMVCRNLRADNTSFFVSS